LNFQQQEKIMSTSTLKTLLALMVMITAVWVTNTVSGAFVVDHQLVFTENSSSSLTATYDASPLTVTPTPGSPDQWTFSLPVGFVDLTTFVLWTEPDNSNLVNSVGFSNGTVFSDVTNPGGPALTNGTPVQVGSDGGVAVFATFNDVGDVATVPDTGTSFSLFGLSLMGLAFLRRKIPA
jgi:VPDSG-CTERM motif